MQIAIVCGRADVAGLAEELDATDLNVWREWFDQNPPLADRIERYLVQLTAVVAGAAGMKVKESDFRIRFGTQAEADRAEERELAEANWALTHGNIVTD
jgi:hypothetical protein